jgi:ankyrin repeat protein
MENCSGPGWTDCGAAEMRALPASKGIAARGLAAGATLALMLSLSSAALAGPIHTAARKGDKATVIALLKQNPDLVSSKDSLGYTPLHLAAKYDQPEIVDLLLANGADVNAQAGVKYAGNFGGTQHYGDTPLTLALLSYHHKRVMELLVTHGADVNVALSNGDTPLSRAIDQNLPYDVQLLLANGANPDYPICNGQTAVHRAAIAGKIEILKMLLDYRADPNAQDLAKHTPLYYIDDGKVADVLRAYGGHK